ncbi:MAG: acyl carrier protein [Betaproteobacteria bacterium]|nr:MAG: acyl carrier protein [Betaproteobacteria bacterium]
MLLNSFDYIRQVLVDKFEVNADAITPEATFESLGLDSLTMVELMFDISDKYEIEIPTDRLDFKTLGEAVALIDETLLAKNS